MPRKKRRSKKIQNIIDTLFFYLITSVALGGLVIYLWVYTEIDDSLYALDIQNKTVQRLSDDIQSVKSKIDALSKPDVISQRAKEKWGMVFAQPETISVHINSVDLSSL